MERGDQEYDAECADADTLEHAQRARDEPEKFLGVDGKAEHAGAGERAGEIDFLAAVEHVFSGARGPDENRRRSDGVRE
jgi:hypothetical protein